MKTSKKNCFLLAELKETYYNSKRNKTGYKFSWNVREPVVFEPT